MDALLKSSPQQEQLQRGQAGGAAAVVALCFTATDNARNTTGKHTSILVSGSCWLQSYCYKKSVTWQRLVGLIGASAGSSGLAQARHTFPPSTSADERAFMHIVNLMADVRVSMYIVDFMVALRAMNDTTWLFAP